MKSRIFKNVGTGQRKAQEWPQAQDGPALVHWSLLVEERELAFHLQWPEALEHLQHTFATLWYIHLLTSPTLFSSFSACLQIALWQRRQLWQCQTERTNPWQVGSEQNIETFGQSKPANGPSQTWFHWGMVVPGDILEKSEKPCHQPLSLQKALGKHTLLGAHQALSTKWLQEFCIKTVVLSKLKIFQCEVQYEGRNDWHDLIWFHLLSENSPFLESLACRSQLWDVRLRSR